MNSNENQARFRVSRQWKYGWAFVAAVIAVACGGSGSAHLPATSLAQAVQQISSTDPVTVTSGINSAARLAGFGDSSLSSDYNGLTISSTMRTGLVNSQVKNNAGTGTTASLSDAYDALVASKATTLPTLAVFLQKLNADIVFSFGHINEPNAVVPVLIAVNGPTIPKTPPTLIASSRIGSIQGIMLAAWASNRVDKVVLPAAGTRDDTDDLICQIAVRNQKFVKLGVFVGRLLGMYTKAEGDSMLASAQSNVDQACHHQGGG